MMNQSLGRALDRSGILGGHCEIVPSDGQGLINHALKAKALLSSSDCGRGFGSVFRHHTQGLGQSPGPFSWAKSSRHAGFRPPVLRAACCRNARNRPLSRPEPSLFSVWPAGRRRWGSRKINKLRVPVQRQPRPPVRHRAPPEDHQRLLDCIAIEIHNCGNRGFDHGSFHDAARPGGRRNQDASQ